MTSISTRTPSLRSASFPSRGTTSSPSLRLALPKGRMQAEVDRLLGDAGLEISTTDRGYRPRVDGIDGIETKRLKPQAIVSMLANGTRDLGFAGADWVEELELDLVEVLDTGLDRVRIVAAAPEGVRLDAGRTLRIASEMPRIAARWAAARGIDWTPVRSWGATEVLPPEDADVIVDVVQTGSTLAANGLRILDVIATSPTRLFASRNAMQCSERRAVIERIAALIESVIQARSRFLVELNVESDRLQEVLGVIPCMRRPTVSPLAGDGFAVRAAVPRRGFPELVAAIRQAGGTDLVVGEARQVIP